MENNNRPLLSICIPTYNRAEILNNTLNALTSDPAFNNEIEIVISDNCSPDNTTEVCKKYTKIFPNVKYYRNEENVKDRNFLTVLERAEGEYLKIINDTVTFKQGKLSKVLECIKSADRNAALLFPPLSNTVSEVTVIKAFNKNQVLSYLSYNSTWISSFGIWKKDVKNICKGTAFESQLAQVCWIFKLSINTNVLLYFDDYYDVKWTEKKGNYNYMEVFVNNYLNILKDLRFKKVSIEIEKYRLLGLLSNYYYIMKYTKRISYSNKDAFKIMYKQYWFEPYFYVKFPVLVFGRFVYDKVFGVLSSYIKSSNKKHYQK